MHKPLSAASTCSEFIYSTLTCCELDLFPPSPPDQLLNLDNLLIQLQSLNAMWHNLGVALDVPDSILDDIKDQCRANPEQCMVEMVDAWMTRQTHVGKPTWTDLATGLRKINQTKLADALENIYNTGTVCLHTHLLLV